MHKLLFAVLLVTLTSVGNTQENNIWYFGSKAGLDFNPTPTGVFPVVLANSPMVASEGSASICNKQGALLFYTNGVTIYNRNHEVMQNGDNLLGHLSAVQSSVIIPQPGSPNIFYVFTTDAIENDFEQGYRYSIVDLTQAGGLGAVTSKNVLISSSCTEKMVAARHADGVSVWVILNNNNSNLFQAWLITCSGLSSSPVVSTVGETLNQNLFVNSGSMKISPDGTMLCQTHFATVGPNSNNFAQLFDFDNFTGQITNPRKIKMPNAQVIGSEFSPDSKLLYLIAPFSKEIFQVECKLPTPADIENSRTRFPVPSTTFYGIQLGPDGKIYLAQTSQHLSVISRPNVKGTGCNLQMDKVNLAPGFAVLGLPNFINDLSVNPRNGFDYTITDTCTATVSFNGFASLPGTLTWDWDFGDGNTSAQKNPVHSYADGTQPYTVTLKITSTTACAMIERTRVVYPGGLNIVPQFSFVAKCDSGYVRFINESSIFPDNDGVQYRWDFGDGNFSNEENPIHPYPTGGSYNITLEVLTSTACLNKSITIPINLDQLDVQAPADMTVDANVPVQLFVTGGGSEFAWSPNIGLNDSTLSNPIALPPKSMWYKVTAKNDAGCLDSDSVYIKVNPLPGIYVPTGFTPNRDGKNDLFRPTLTKEYTLQEFTLFNRWGEKIYTTSQKEAGWDGYFKGMIQETGAYIWILRATDTRNGEKYALKGTFVLIH
jgi:gliding motility-associated-like protein